MAEKTTAPLIVARGIITNETGALLLAQRAYSCKYNGGQWEFPGGKLEKEERSDPLAALYREIYEEVTIETILDAKVIHMDHYLMQCDSGETRRRTTTFRLGVAATDIISYDPIEVEDAAWTTREQAAELDLTTASRAALQAYGSLLLAVAS